MSLLDAFSNIKESSGEQEKIDSPLGKKGHYVESEDAEFGKGGFYSKDKPERHREGKPVNVGVIVISLIALLAVGIFLFYSNGTQNASNYFQSSSSFELKVLAGEARVANAAVSVYDGEKLIATINTDEKGIAQFDNLPEKELSFSVSASGLGQTAMTTDVSSTTRANVKFKNIPVSLKTMKVTIQDKTTKQPIPDVKVFYSVGNAKEQKITQTNEIGLAVIDLNGESIVKYRIAADGYKMTAGTILATKEAKPIELEAKIQTGNESIFFEETPTETNQEQIQTNTLTLTINGQTISTDGIEVKLVTPITLSEITTGIAQNGQVQFNELPSGSFEIQINANGYYPYDEIIQLPTQREFTVNLQEIPITAKSTTFNITTNEQFTIQIYNANTNQLVTKTQLNTGDAIDLSVDNQYLAAIITEYNLPLITDKFNAGDTIYGELIEASEENSRLLSIEVVDDEQNSLAGVKIIATNEKGIALSQTKETQFNTPVEFQLAKGQTVKITATLNSITKTQTITLNEDTSQTIELKTNAAYLQLNLTDLSTGLKPTTTVTLISIDREGRKYDECQYPCTLALRASEENTVKINADGYAPLTFATRAPDAMQTTIQNSKLIPTAIMTQTPQTDAITITDKNGKTVSGTILRTNENYELKFNAYAKDANSITIFALIDSPNAIILEPTASEGFEIQKSTIRNPPSATCTDLEETGNTPPYKWVQITALNTTNAEIKIPIKTLQNGTLQIKYNIQARKGDLILRNPKDDELKIFENTDKKAGCYAQTKQQEYQIITPTKENNQNTIENTNNAAKLEIPKVTGADTAIFNPQFKQINTGNSQYEMQADSIFPADAFPLTLQNDATCQILLAIENSTTSQCFTYDPSNKILKFATKEINPNCPIQIKADDFYLNENKITNINAEVKLATTCADVHKNIPVKVKLITIPTTLITPEMDKLGDGDTPKLLYVINNAQFQNRKYEVQTEQNTKIINANPTSVNPIAWKNQGQLSISTNGVTIADYFAPIKTTPLKKGTGTISYKQDTCQDENCCAQGWCLSKQITTQTNLLIAKTKELAAQTAFRRGENTPWKYYTQNPFTITTVTQAALNSQNALIQAKVQLTTLAGCSPKNPQVMQLNAELNSTNSEVQLKARTLQLNSQDYLQPATNCASTSKNAPKSQTTTDGSTALCGFLQGQNNCVYSTNESTPLSLDQVDKLRFELINCIYPIMPGLPACPATATFALPAINLGNLKATAELTDKNAFAKLWQSVTGAEKYNFELFSFSNQVQCIVPPSFMQLALFAGTNLIDSTPDKAKKEADDKQPAGASTGGACSSDFYQTFNNPISDNLLSLAGVCCANTVQATACTPRSGKLFLKVEENEIKVIANWGLTESCYPYFPLPLNPNALTQKGNLASIAVGMYQYYKSGGTNVEFTLSTEKPGFKPTEEQTITKGSCAATDSTCPDQKETIAGICITYTNGKCQNGSCHYNHEKKKLQEGQTC